MSSWVGKAYKAYKSYKRSKRIEKGGRGPDIKSVKPMSGKIPPHVSVGGKNLGRRKEIVKTHFSVKRTDKIDKAEKQIKEGTKTLKDMEATGQAYEFKDYRGKGTGTYFKKGFKD